MMKIEHYKKLSKLTDAQGYNVMIKTPTMFIGYDTIRDKYCIVYYERRRSEYIIPISKPPQCYDTLEDAMRIFSHVTKQEIIGECDGTGN